MRPKVMRYRTSTRDLHSCSIVKQLGQPAAFSRRNLRPKLCLRTALCIRGRREGRVSATPAAPVHKKSTGKEPQVRTEQSGLPCAMVLRFIARSPRGPGLIAPVASRSFCSLSLSVGRPGPHAFTVRNGSAHLARRDVHRIPLSTSVTIAKRPSCEGGTHHTWHRFPKNGSKVLHRGQTTRLALELAREILFLPAAIFARGAASRPQEFVPAARIRPFLVVASRGLEALQARYRFRARHRNATNAIERLQVTAVLGFTMSRDIARLLAANPSSCLV